MAYETLSLEQIDAQIAEFNARAKHFEKMLVDARNIEEILTIEGQTGQATRSLATELRKLHERRAMLVAGLVQPEPISPPAHPSALTLPLDMDLKHGEPADDDERFVNVAYDFLQGIRTAIAGFCKGPHQPVAYTQARHQILDSAIITLRGLAQAGREREAALEARIQRLEAVIPATPMKYAGIWQRALPYAAGSVVTLDGSAWVAIKDATPGDRPGSPDSAFQMMVKAGRDGRDGVAK